MRHGVILLSGLIVSGCTSVEDPFLTSAIAPSAPAISQEVSPDLAVASLPSMAGSAVSVRQTARETYLKQTIVYPNRTALAGENALTVEAGRESAESSGALRAPSRRQVEAEMREVLPGIAMQIADTIDENGQGIYGYASGALPSGGSCIYAWQVTGQGDRMAGAALSSRQLPARIRLRYCHPSIPQERIGAMMQAMRLIPLNGQMLAMLRAQAGSGVMASRLSPVAPQMNTPAEDVAVSEEVRPVRPRPAAIVSQSPRQAEPQAEPAIANAARIPLPSKGKAPADPAIAKVEQARAQMQPAPVLRKSVSVPLPQ